MTLQSIPETLALIPDGNRRWARKNRLSMSNGYELGVKKFIDFSNWCQDFGIKNITVWALSSDNIKRSPLEVKVLFSVYNRVANDKALLDLLIDNKTCLKIIGNSNIIPRELMTALHKLEMETQAYTGKVINMLMGYGGRDDIIYAAKKYAMQFDAGKRGTAFEKYLMTNAIPDIDLIIRTSGEQRLSGFMPWQSNYSELYFSKKMWPDFTRKDLELALKNYSARQRRFGK